MSNKTNETPNLPTQAAIAKYCASYIANTLTDEQKNNLTRIFVSFQRNIKSNTNKENKQ